ncbi:hypothetical protein HJC23_012016 [Cyclotella cryptica]|uniref:Uncharacterized protein n=1 Tax=Cyclotella cryptica TaxID=29204 RepID=A0ABD3QQJ6_9STRA
MTELENEAHHGSISATNVASTELPAKAKWIIMRRLHPRAFAIIALLFYTTTTLYCTDAFLIPSTHCKIRIDNNHASGKRNLPSKRRINSRNILLVSNEPPSPPEFFRGRPSTPGFKPGQFEKLTSWAMSQDSNRPIVTEYDPDGLWLWTQWEGTIREMTFTNVAIALIWALVVDLYAYQHYTVYLIATAAVNGGDVATLLDNLTWTSFEIPHSRDPIIEAFQNLNSLWEYQLSLTTFTLSFFVNHAYSHWRLTYFCTRAIQGRVNDLCMLITLGAARSKSYGEVDGVTGYQTKAVNGDSIDGRDKDAKKLVQDITRLLRMSHTLFWAATPTRSDGMGDLHLREGGILGDDLPKNFDPSQFGPMLLSREGLEMLVKYGQLTQREKEGLVACGLPPSQYPYVLLEWAGLRAMDGIEKGELRGGPGMEENLLRQLSLLRGEYFNIGDYNAGRMPMAYVQVMEVLVDTLNFLAPLALYTKMGTFNIISTGLLTLFFKGLLELSKSFLDPFGREGYSAHNIRVDVLVSELNFGASSRWIDAGDVLPSEIVVKSEIESTSQSNEQSTVEVSKYVKVNGEESLTSDFNAVEGGVNQLSDNIADEAPLVKFDLGQNDVD